MTILVIRLDHMTIPAGHHHMAIHLDRMAIHLDRMIILLDRMIVHLDHLTILVGHHHMTIKACHLDRIPTLVNRLGRMAILVKIGRTILGLDLMYSKQR